MTEMTEMTDFSTYLFWDVDRRSLDVDKHAKYIVKNVLMFGQLDDWRRLNQLYGLGKIVELACSVRDLDKRSMSFIAAVSGTPLEKFRCFTTKQSTPGHWNY